MVREWAGFRFHRSASGKPLACAVIFLLAAWMPKAPAQATPPPATRPNRIDWWRDVRFGMFIHWGLYSIPGRGEWVQWDEQIPVDEYAKLAQQFNPTNFHPDAWAQVAKSAGMKYMVLTARHHDGFCLFDDKGNDFTSMKTASHRDFVAEYAAAVRRAGLHVGIYYSPLDWRFAGFFFPDLQRPSADAMRQQYHRQMDELLSNYGKLDVIWFDGGETDWLNFGANWGSGAAWHKRPKDQHYQGNFSWKHDEVYATLRRRQPEAIINGRADMPEDFHAREGDDALGDFDDQHPWELCATLAGAWGWQPHKPVRSLQSCVQLLAKTASRDGNLLLNVGMRPDGDIDPPQVERLREVGEWLGKNSESIYGTRGGPFLPGDYGGSTHRGNKVYIHVLHWDHDKLILPPLPGKIVRASVMGAGALVATQTDHAIEIEVPPAERSDIDTIVVLEFDRSMDDIQTVGAALTPATRQVH